MHYHIRKHVLQFKFVAGTSRGTLTEKETWFIRVFERSNPTIFGIGECSPLKGLSVDGEPGYEQQLGSICARLFAQNIADESPSAILERIPLQFPSIRFGVETALLDLKNGGRRQIFDGEFYRGKKAIPINGLVWMGDRDFMLSQIKEKIEAGFRTLKIKVGAIDHSSELDLLRHVRKHFAKETVEIRLDANGAFREKNVYQALNEFSVFGIHSIEQPVKQGNIRLMKEVCQKSPIPVALDEELIGVIDPHEQTKLLDEVNPHYIILKPSLLGGLEASGNWIKLAEQRNIGWWMTSLLESNIGLNAIAQFTSTMDVQLPQGLGTGQLYHNNIPSPLQIKEGNLKYDPRVEWGFDGID